MGKETKIGLTVLGLLIGVFGLVVYFKVFRAVPGPSPEALASALENGAPPATDAEPVSLESGPAVQLSPGDAEQAPVEFADNNVASDGSDMPTEEHGVAHQSEQADLSAPPLSSRRRYADPAGDDREAAAPLEAAADEPQELVDNSVEEPQGADLEEPIEADVAAQAAALHDASASTENAEWAAETSPAEQLDPTTIDPRVRAQGSVQQTPPAELEPAEPMHFTPSPVVAVPGETIHAGAQEAVEEPPTTVEQPGASRGDRYGRAAAPAYRSEESEVSEQPPVERPASPKTMAPVSRPRANPYERPAAPARMPAEENFARPDQSYTIEPNDNYWRISQKLYGSGAYFKALFEHNRQKFPRADRLRQGDVISAPPTDVLEKTYPDLCPRPQHRQVEKNMLRAVSNRRQPRGDRVYVVEEGDTLFDIAKYELGQASRWGELYELNRDLLGDQGDHLKPGMELVLPSKVARESVAAEPGNPVR